MTGCNSGLYRYTGWDAEGVGSATITTRDMNIITKQIAGFLIGIAIIGALFSGDGRAVMEYFRGALGRFRNTTVREARYGEL